MSGYEEDQVELNQDRLLSEESSNAHHIPIVTSLQGVLMKDISWKNKSLFFFLECVKFITLVLFAVISWRRAVTNIRGQVIMVGNVSCNEEIPDVDKCSVTKFGKMEPSFYIMVAFASLYNAVIISFTTIDLYQDYDIFKKVLNKANHHNWSWSFAYFHFINIQLWIICSSITIIGYTDLPSMLTNVALSLAVVEMDKLVLMKSELYDDSGGDAVFTKSNREKVVFANKDHYFYSRVFTGIGSFILPLFLILVIYFFLGENPKVKFP